MSCFILPPAPAAGRVSSLLGRHATGHGLGISPTHGLILAGALAVAALVLGRFRCRGTFCPGAGRYPPWRLNYFKGWTGKDGRPTTRLDLCLPGAGGLDGAGFTIRLATGDLTIPLGALGILGGYFSFAPPLAWHAGVWGRPPVACASGCCRWLRGFTCKAAIGWRKSCFYGLPLTFAGFNLFLVTASRTPRRRRRRLQPGGPVGAR